MIGPNFPLPGYFWINFRTGYRFYSKRLHMHTLSRTFLIFLSILLLYSCANDLKLPDTVENGDTSYLITGMVTDATAGSEVVLSVFDPIAQSKTPIDTAMVDSEGKYELSYQFEHPDLFRVDFFREQSVMLAIDEGQSNILLDVEGKSKEMVTIQGSPDSELLLAYDSFRLDSYDRLIKPAYAAMTAATEAGDQQAEVAAVMQYAANSEIHRAELIDYTKEHIGTSIALYGTSLRWTGDDQVAKLDELVEAFAAVHPDLEMTTRMQAKVDRYRAVAIGAKAPDINLPDQNGQTIALYDNLGTFTLIDFWASWCRPCLLQVPDLKQAQVEFGDRGFQIFSVSADTKGDKWRKAIEEYNLDWPNVSDLKGWESEAANAYNATFLPYNLLIDSEGTIIAKNLHSKELQTMLAKLYQTN
jgi:peroxiredoxin